MNRIISFTGLEAWREGHKLVLNIYKITKFFPKEEIFGLTNQMRRCAVSVTSNIAEGFSRHRWKEKLQFYSITLGSMTELESQLLIARDIKYLDNKIFEQIANQMVQVSKLVNGLIKKSKSMINP
jgi:four helix bundle protein